jgi:hypothetical protein
MYTEPIISIGILIFGITDDSRLQNNVQTSITTEKPLQIPKLKGIVFLKPSRPAFDIDIMLFGPGVTAVMTAYVRKFSQLNMVVASLDLWWYNGLKMQYTKFLFIVL